MTEKNLNTEQLILDSARIVFLQKGFDGARMQEIADVAGINKSLLHYYFRSKDLLFEAIFNEAFSKFIPKVSSVLGTELSFKEKIEFFVESYIDMFIENPFIPGFILTEINRNPDKIINMILQKGINPKFIEEMLKKELESNNIIGVSGKDFLINLISMCVFPFAGRPMIQALLFENNQEDYLKFLQNRKKSIPQFIFNSLK